MSLTPRPLGLCCFVLCFVFSPLLAPPLQGQEDDLDSASPARGSLIEDRAARKLLEAGDARIEADEPAKAAEIWQSVVERYPRSRFRYDAHMRLGNYLLERERAYDRARGHFVAVADEENRDEEQRAEATLKTGICFYEARNFGKSFKVMREVIEQFPVSPQVNEAYYYIGLGHFQLGHYSRAIEALEKVGTAFSDADNQVEKVEAGKRLFIKVEDADLAALETDQVLKVRCETTQGDVELVDCYQVGRNVRVVLGSVLTRLGRPQPENGVLEVRGDDQVKVTYIDAHTADRTFDRPVGRDIEVVGSALVSVTDGAFREKLQGVALGREVHLQIIDADRDVTDESDKIQAVIAVYRQKSNEEIETEVAAAAAKGLEGEEGKVFDPEDLNIDRFKEVDRVEIELTEALEATESPAAQNPALTTGGLGEADPAQDKPQDIQPPGADKPAAGEDAPKGDEDDKPKEEPQAPASSTAQGDAVHSGVFRLTIPLELAEEIVVDDAKLQARPNDVIRITYVDDKHRGAGSRTVKAEAQCVEGNLGAVRVSRTEISDQELLIKTKLKTASALTNIGNRYKEFGLKRNADRKYEEALTVCEEISGMARQLGGRLLEETYVQLWRIYYEMDRLELAAAMAQRLQREFPNSAFIDEALLQLADVARKQGELGRAIGIYQRLVAMQTSLLRGEAQFGIAQCYEELAAASNSPTQLYDRSFQEYKKVYDQFPESGRVGEAVAKMANYYYQQQDYARAIDTFETVLNDHPDAQFLDVILFNYGRCLIKMKRLPESKRQFDQLIGDFPESALAEDAKKISEALSRAVGG